MEWQIVGSPPKIIDRDNSWLLANENLVMGEEMIPIQLNTEIVGEVVNQAEGNENRRGGSESGAKRVPGQTVAETENRSKEVKMLQSNNTSNLVRKNCLVWRIKKVKNVR